MNLREDKGYSYGVESHFSFLRGPGPFEAGGTVQTAATRPALVELFKELTQIGGPRPVNDAELAFAKAADHRGFPQPIRNDLRRRGPASRPRRGGFAR